MTAQEAERCKLMVNTALEKLYQQGKFYQESNSEYLRINQEEFKSVAIDLQNYFQSYMNEK